MSYVRFDDTKILHLFITTILFGIVLIYIKYIQYLYVLHKHLLTYKSNTHPVYNTKHNTL